MLPTTSPPRTHSATVGEDATVLDLVLLRWPEAAIGAWLGWRAEDVQRVRERTRGVEERQ